MRGGFRTRIFLATFSVAAVMLLIAAAALTVILRRQTYERIERGLVAEARLAAELLSHRAETSSRSDLNDEARTVGRDIDARVTLIASDGRVVGDSSQDDDGVGRLENHGGRPEVVEARTRGIGIATRASATLGIDMLYVAAPVTHPSIATIRLALPLTEINRQFRTIWLGVLYALGLAAAGAFAMAWITAAILVRRLTRLEDNAKRYSLGEAPRWPPDREHDEIGNVGRALDDAVRQLGERAVELRRDRARLEGVLAGMVEGVLVIDAEDRIELANDAASRLLDLDRAALGRHYLECLRHPAVVSEIASVRSGGGMTTSPPVIHEHDRTIVVRATAVNGPEGDGVILVLHDVTDLERTDRIRRDFVANVSHELRTPLTAIRGYTEALEEPDLQPAQRREFLDIIARQSSRMERLVSDLLKLARLEAGNEAVERSACSLEEILRAVIADHEPAARAKSQRIRWDVDPSVQAIATDAQRLADALRNLLENAIRYSPEGTVTTLSARPDGERAAISVTDQGPGIPASDLTRVFERFYRVDKARSRDSGGTGLGLAIVKHLVETIGGTVEAANHPAGGAVFTIRIPRRV